MAKSKELKGYPALELLAMVVDPDDKEKAENVCKAIALHFDRPYEHNATNRSALNAYIAKYLSKKGWSERKEEEFWSIDVEGLCSIEHHYTQMKYLTDDMEYTVVCHERALLFINGKKMKEVAWDERHVLGFIQDMEDLFSKPGNYELSFEAIHELAFTRFSKGCIWDSLNQFRHACNLIVEHRYGSLAANSTEYFAAKKEAGWFIFYQWCAYLWEQDDANKPADYILSLRTFISRNQDSWASGEKEAELKVKVYCQEHVNLINALEPEVRFGMSVEDSILLIWKSTSIIG